MCGKKKRISDAVEILQRRYYEGKPSRIAQVEQQRADDEIARQIYALREKAGLTQKRLAELVGTTPSVISRLEDSDYESHSLTMLKRIAAALNKKIEIRFVSLDKFQPAWWPPHVIEFDSRAEALPGSNRGDRRRGGKDSNPVTFD